MNAPTVRCPAPECDWRAPAPHARCPTHGLLAVDAGLIDPSRPWLGHVINDRYGLIGYLGGGGHGAVYRSLDLRLGRSVAVKLLNPSVVGSKRLRQRFEREARLLSGLRSVHTLTVFDYGVGDGPMAGVAYMVTELVEGPSLAERLRDGPLDVEDWSTVVAQTVRSLTEAHRRGIVHRDLKPGNILLARDPDGGLETRVIDLGIARLEGEGQTTSGAIVGTPRYLAPEQCGFEGGGVDVRTDVYALALVVWEMIVGRPAYAAPTVVALIADKMTRRAPHLPGAASDDRVARVDAVLQVALAQRRAERYDSADAFWAALSEALGREDTASGVVASAATPLLVESVLAEPVPPVARGGRRRVTWAGLLIAALCGAALVWWALYDPDPPPPPGPVVDGAMDDMGDGMDGMADGTGGGIADAHAMPDGSEADAHAMPDGSEADARGDEGAQDSGPPDRGAPPVARCTAGRVSQGVRSARARPTRGACRKALRALERACRHQRIPRAASVCGTCGDGEIQEPYEVCDPKAAQSGGYCKADCSGWAF